MRILIVGISGFVGTNLAKYLLSKKDVSIIGVDYLQNAADLHNVFSNKKLTEFYIANAKDKHVLDIIFDTNRPDVVIFLAQKHSGTYQDILTNETVSLINVIDGCIRHNSKLIYLSNARHESCIFDIVKTTCENLISLYDINYAIIRTPELFGSRSRKGLIADMFLDIKGNEKIILSNKGVTERDLLHVDDLCSAILLILDKEEKETYTVSANNDFSDFEIASFIIDIIKEGKIELLGDYDNVKNDKLDVDKIKNIGWVSGKFKDRLHHTIRWYNNNTWFFK